jgi:CheY-like chemotaxis protein
MTKLLLIEDEDNLRISLKQRLELEGYSVIDAPDGQSGIKMAADNLPDLVLCDIMLPDIDGYSVLETLRAREETSEIPFIFMSARTESTDVRKGMNLGADDYLCKPVAKLELLEAIRSRLQKRAKQQAAENTRVQSTHQRLARTLPHELLTPLTGILGPAQCLESEIEESSKTEIRQLGKWIRLSAERLHATVRRVLLYADLLQTVAAPQESPSPTPIWDASKTIADAAKRVAEHWKRTSDLNLAIDRFPTNAQEDAIIALTDELVDNAFKFSPSGTPVTVSSQTSENSSKLSVADQGRGLSSENIKAIRAFLQFHREKYEQQGLGLGLAIVQLQCQLLSGKFDFERNSANGTTTSVSLPVVTVVIKPQLG